MLLDDFNHTLDRWITELPSYSFMQLCTQPDPESWSLGQLYRHLIEETSYYIEQMKACLTSTENASEEMTDRAKALFSKNEFPNKRIQGDKEVAQRVPQPISKLQLEKELKELKSAVNPIWHTIAGSQRSGKTRHPGEGYFSAEQWLQYAEMHLRHHLRQKQRIDEFLNW